MWLEGMTTQQMTSRPIRWLEGTKEAVQAQGAPRATPGTRRQADLVRDVGMEGEWGDLGVGSLAATVGPPLTFLLDQVIRWWGARWLVEGELPLSAEAAGEGLCRMEGATSSPPRRRRCGLWW